MKRTISTAILAGLTLFSIGCCYRPGGCDPVTGMAYAGQYQPACYGPLDPLGMWCGNNPWNNCCPNQQAYSPQLQQGGCCPQQYGNAYSNPMMVPQTFATPDCYQNAIPGGAAVPGGNMKPVPAPGSEGGSPPAGSKKAAMRMPQPMMPVGVMQGANNGQWVKAF